MFTFNPNALTEHHVSLADRVIATARSIIGQREEPNNSGFKDPIFEQRIKDVGWSKGESWCAYTAELIWRCAFTKEHPLYLDLDKLFSGSAIKTFENFAKSIKFYHGDYPKPGALVIWRHGKGWQGHAGIVTAVLSDNSFKSVEGNTNSQGGREGIEVAEKIRYTGQPFNPKGLNIEGFVWLPNQ